MATDPVYADLTELYDRFAAADIVRFADETGVLNETGDGQTQVKTAYNGGSVSGTSNEVDAANEAADTVKDALRDAEAEVNGYLQGTYDVPVAGSSDETPRILRRLTCHIAHYNLQEAPTQAARERYEDAKEELKMIARGTIQLGIQVDGDDSPAGGSQSSVHEAQKTFSEGSLDSWKQGGNAFPAKK